MFIIGKELERRRSEVGGKVCPKVWEKKMFFVFRFRLYLGANPLDVELEELWNVVDKREDDDRHDERTTFVRPMAAREG